MTLKLQYKKWIKAVEIIVGIGAYVFLYCAFNQLIFPYIGGPLFCLLTVTAIVFVSCLYVYVMATIKDKVVINSNTNTMKVYSLSTIFWRSNNFDEIDNIIIEKNSELKYSWIYKISDKIVSK